MEKEMYPIIFLTWFWVTRLVFLLFFDV